MRILIVDDEEHIRRLMRLTLEAAGHEIGEAADGPRALEAFGNGSAWDLMLLDQKMPGLQGLDTLRILKTRAPGFPVIMVTAFASPSIEPTITPQHSSGNVDWAWSTMVFHAPDSILIIPEGLAQIFGGAVAENRNDDACAALFYDVLRDAGGRVDVRAG